MLFPKVLKENEYICLFLVKTDKKVKKALNKPEKKQKIKKENKIMGLVNLKDEIGGMK